VTLSAEIRAALPTDTAVVWDEIAPLVPEGAYLAGGTAIAVRLKHRVSRDLDFFFHRGTVDLARLREALERTGRFAATTQAAETLNGVYSETRVQFLHADAGGRASRLLVQPEEVSGLRVAGLPDLIAMKLKVVAQRGELRDYFDIMEIERAGGVTAELGITYYLARFEPEDPHDQVSAIIRGLGYFEDVDDDDSLPVGREAIERYWRQRQPQVLRSAGWLNAGGTPPPAPELQPVGFPGGTGGRHWVRPHTRRGRQIAGYYRG
jgi:hypothetical protein